MATQGPLYPGTVTTEIGPSGDNDWTSPGNISADDGALASITAATFDAGDDSYRLKAQNFGFTIPTGATIDGIVVEIERSNAAGAASDNEVRLYDETGTLVGDNKAAAGDWPTALTLATYGGATDDWLPAGSWTPAQVNDPDFGVAFIVNADAANTDIAVDFIRVTVHYTPPALDPTRGQISFAELEVPLVPTRGRLSWAELEVPLAPTRGRLSFAELEVPGVPTRGLVSWAELEVPMQPTRGRISFAELEMPLAPTRGRMSWAELEAPLAPTRGLTSFAELEVPGTPTRGLISFAEFQVPSVGAMAGDRMRGMAANTGRLMGHR